MATSVPKLALGALITIASLSNAGAQVLWQQSRAGMTVDEVLKAVPGTQRQAPNSGDNLADGAVDLVTASDQRISDKVFHPKFYFLNGRLEQVTLTLQGVNKSSDARSSFEDVYIALRQKYGPEVVLKDTAIGKEAEWLRAGTNIVLFLIAITEDDPVLNINYQVRVAADASHL
jgi:hypothetical protein